MPGDNPRWGVHDTSSRRGASSQGGIRVRPQVSFFSLHHATRSPRGETPRGGSCHCRAGGLLSVCTPLVRGTTHRESRERELANWRNAAACLGMDTDLFFPIEVIGGPKGISGEKDRTEAAKKICAGCQVQADCLD